MPSRLPQPPHRAPLLELVRLGPVQLDAAAAPADDAAPRWIQIAYEGRFEGHRAGAFEFDRQAFEDIVRNFRAHPAYKKGPDGKGCARVIAYDFHHASESDPAAVAVHGAPAQAWAH